MVKSFLSIAVFMLLSVSANAQIVKCVYEGTSHDYDDYTCEDGHDRYYKRENLLNEPKPHRTLYGCKKGEYTGYYEAYHANAFSKLFIDKPIAYCADLIEKAKKRMAQTKQEVGARDVRNFASKCFESYSGLLFKYLRADNESVFSWSNLGMQQRIDESKRYSCEEPKNGYGITIRINEDFPETSCKKGTYGTINVGKDYKISYSPEIKKYKCFDLIAQKPLLSTPLGEKYLYEGTVLPGVSEIMDQKKALATEKKYAEEKEKLKSAWEKAKLQYVNNQKFEYSFDFACSYGSCGDSKAVFRNSAADDIVRLGYNVSAYVSENQAQNIRACQGRNYSDPATDCDVLNMSQNRDNLRLEFLIVADWGMLNEWNTEGYWDDKWGDKDYNESCKDRIGKIMIEAGFEGDTIISTEEPYGNRTRLVHEVKNTHVMLPIDKYFVDDSVVLHPLIKKVSIPLSDFPNEGYNLGMNRVKTDILFGWSRIHNVQFGISGNDDFTCRESRQKFGNSLAENLFDIVNVVIVNTNPQYTKKTDDENGNRNSGLLNSNENSKGHLGEQTIFGDEVALQKESLNNDNAEIVEEYPKQEKASAAVEAAKQNNGEKSMSTTKLLRIGVFSAVALGGGIAALVFDKKAKDATATPPANRAEFQKGHDDAKQNQNVRNISLGVAAAGLVALGLTFLF